MRAGAQGLARQRRWKAILVGKGAPDVMWRFTVGRDNEKAFFASEAVDEDQLYEVRGLSKNVYKMLMKHRWQDEPMTPRIEPKNWVVTLGDVVEVVSGADKGKRGRLLECFHPAMKVKVEGVRVEENEGQHPTTGQLIKTYQEQWVDYDDVRPIDPRIDQPVDCEWMKLEDPATGEVIRSRVSLVTGTVIPMPEPLSSSERQTGEGDLSKDTPTSVASEVTLAGGNIAGEINEMALVKLKVLEGWFLREMEKLHTKDKKLRDSLAAEQREFHHHTYQLALQKVIDQVKEEEPWLLPEVAELRAASRPPPGAMPDFVFEQEYYRELRRGARFQLKRDDLRPTDSESMYERFFRSTQQGVKMTLMKEARDRYEWGTAPKGVRERAKDQARYKIAKMFLKEPMDYVRSALEYDSAIREKAEIGEGFEALRDKHIGWETPVQRVRSEVDAWENRFGHMRGVMEDRRTEAADAAVAGSEPPPEIGPGGGR